MADIKITDLTELTGVNVNSADLFEIVDFDADASKKVSVTSLTTYFNANLSFLASGDNVSDLTNDAGYLTTISGQNISLLTNDSGYLTSISGLNNSLLTNDAGYITNITSSPLSDLSDVTITGIASGELLKWNGTAWINNTIAEAGLATSAQGALADSATQPGDNVSTLTNDAGYLTSISGLNNSLLTNDAGYITNITGSPLSDLSDVTITTIASGELLKWNGSAWINNTIAEAGLATSAQGALADSATQPGDNISTLTNDSGYLTTISGLNISLLTNDSGYLTSISGLNISLLTNDSGYLTSISGLNISLLTNDSGYLTAISGQSIKDLSDVFSSMTPTDGQVLTYDTTNGWQAETSPAGVTDHGLLTGLGDDDHTQYTRTDGTRQITGSQDFAASTSLTWNSVGVLVDSAGTMTLSNIDALDATTEATIESAIDTLNNLTSAPSLSITESQISDLGAYLTASSTDTLTNKTINTASNTITIVEADISDLGAYITASTTDTLTNKTINGSNNTITNIGTAELEDNAVTFAKVGDEYTLNNGSLGTSVDWSSYATFEKTLSGNTTLTDSNLKVGTKYLLIDGNFTLTLPTYWTVISGAYDGSASQKNLITVTCFDATGSSEVVVASIVTYS